MDGILLVDKPEGPTSHDIVDEARRVLGTKKIGHAGTLDPPASGLLVLAVGSGLKVLQFMEGHDKEYAFTARFGRVTDTDDATGKTLREADPSALTQEQVTSALTPFRGTLQQVPPRFSAIKKQGRRLHEAARKGETLDVPPRTVTVHALDMQEWKPPLASFTMSCSKGTYVRAVARDLGEALGPGACVEALRRTMSGPFTLDGAVTLDRTKEELQEALLPIDVALFDLPVVRLSTQDADAFTHGRAANHKSSEGLKRIYLGPRFLGVGTSDGAILRPKRVIAEVTPRSG